MIDIDHLKYLANENRKRIINMIYEAKSGHEGGSLSIIDMLTAIYEIDVNFAEEQRSKVVLSKGHTVPALYAVLNSKGIIKDEEMKTLRFINSRLQGHPYTGTIPEVDATTGLLGQGLSIAVGMAIASKMDSAGCRVYCLLGDGEIDEGQIWEATMTASKYKLDNLCIILDNNGLQIDGKIEEVAGLTNIEGKFSNFGLKVINVDGHNIPNLIDAFDTAKQTKGVPTIIIAKTIKGKGVSFMEGKAEWHGKAPKQEEYEKAIEELRRGVE